MELNKSIRFKIKKAPFFIAILLFFSSFYIFIAWLTSYGEKRWILDHVVGFNVFYGDDAYRYFLARSAWSKIELYAYNFMLPVNLALERVVLTLAQESLFYSRAIHGILAAISLCLIYFIGKEIKINRFVMLVAVAFMGLMPLYLFVSLSFYGEFWLSIIFIFSLYLFLKNKKHLSAFFVGLLPLIRPEGIFFLFPITLYFLVKRETVKFFLTVLPGLLYSIFLLFWFDSPFQIGLWRIELRELLNKVPLSENPWAEIKSTYSILLLVPAFLGLFLGPARSIFLWLAGSLLWVAYLFTLIALGLSDYEPRYTYTLIPVFVILCASFFSWFFTNINFSKTRLGIVLVCFFVISIFSDLFLTVDPVKNKIQKDGLFSFLNNVKKGQWNDVFQYHSPEEINGWKKTALNIGKLLKEDEGIDKVIVYDAPIYFYLEREIITNNVTFGYPAMGYLVFHMLLDGQVFIQHSEGEMYSYIRFGVPEFTKEERRVLYVDAMPMPRYPYLWVESGTKLYLFAYHESNKPDVDLKNIKPISKNEIIREYYRWKY